MNQILIYVLLALIFAIAVWMFVKKEKFDLLVLDRPIQDNIIWGNDTLVGSGDLSSVNPLSIYY